MADKITLHGQVMHPSSDRPWSEAHINWSFVGFTTTTTTQRPTDRGTIIADLDGRWSKDFWINQAGDRPSYYVFDFPPDRGLRVKLTRDLPPVCEFSQALLNGVSPESPDYPSLIAMIDDRLAGSGLSLPTGGEVGQGLAIVQASPRVLGWVEPTADRIALKPAIPELGPTVQSAIAANHTAILALGDRPPPELKSLPDLSMAGAADGAIITFKAISQEFELRNDLRNIVIDGGNF
jgi:hypothetical protein